MNAKTYPIVPCKGEWGADIAVNGRPEWLPDGQRCEVFETRWLLNRWADYWNWTTITKIRLPASHGYYADNACMNNAAAVFSGFTASDVEIATARTMGYSSVREALEAFALSKTFDAFNLDTWLSETKANLPAIEAAGHSVTFAPEPVEWAEQLFFDAMNISKHSLKKAGAGDLDENDLAALALIRSRVRPVL